MRRAIATAFGFMLLAGCTAATPGAEGPRSTETGRESVVVGSNTVGERCTQQSDSTRSASVYCGTWEQPSARISRGTPASADTLSELATRSDWRTELNNRFVCNDPVQTALLGPQPSVIMQCTRRVGGWPHVAMVTVVDGTAWYLDGVSASVPVMARSLAIMTGQSSGGEAASRLPGADALLATRLAAQATKSGDIGEYEHLMAAGTRANLASSPVAAERAFRAALTLQQKALGANNPNTADPMMLVALQLSNQGQYAHAEPLFDQAERLARNSADPAAIPRLQHYRGLHELNQNHPDRAMTYLDRAEAGYTALVPPGAAGRPRHAGSTPRIAATFGSLSDMLPDRELLVDPVVQSSLLGIIEVRRNRAIAFKEADRPDEAEASLISAADLSRANNLLQPIVTSRLYRTQGMLDDTRGQQVSAMTRLSLSSNSFTRALPGSRSYAITGLLEGRELLRTSGSAAALPVCRDALRLMRELLVGTDGEVLMPCLHAFAAEAARRPEQAQALQGEMFVAAQLAQSSVTSQQISQSSARLLEGVRDPPVAEAIRKQQDAIQNLSDLYRQRSELAEVRPRAGRATRRRRGSGQPYRHRRTGAGRGRLSPAGRLAGLWPARAAGRSGADGAGCAAAGRGVRLHHAGRYRRVDVCPAGRTRGGGTHRRRHGARHGAGQAHPRNSRAHRCRHIAGLRCRRCAGALYADAGRRCQTAGRRQQPDGGTLRPAAVDPVRAVAHRQGRPPGARASAVADPPHGGFPCSGAGKLRLAAQGRRHLAGERSVVRPRRLPADPAGSGGTKLSNQQLRGERPRAGRAATAAVSRAANWKPRDNCSAATRPTN